MRYNVWCDIYANIMAYFFILNCLNCGSWTWSYEELKVWFGLYTRKDEQLFKIFLLPAMLNMKYEAFCSNSGWSFIICISWRKYEISCIITYCLFRIQWALIRWNKCQIRSISLTSYNRIHFVVDLYQN